MKLILNRIYKGYYKNQVGSVEVSVSEHEGNWTGLVLDWNKSDDEFIVYKTFASTKKVVVNQLTQYFLNK